MKTRSILMTTFYALMMGAGFASCADDPETPEPTIDPVTFPAYILNEGLWGANNANISRFSHNYEGIDTDVYTKINGKEMGDLASAMIEEGEYIYRVLNGSGYVAKLDATTKEQVRYPLSNPRCIDVKDDYAYVTQYGGLVRKLDINDMSLVATFEGGDNLEGIVEKEGKLYVANSWKSIDNYNKEILVIDTKTMKQTGTIPVVENPVNIYNIDNNIYVISQGNYYDVPAALQVIDTKTGTSKVILNDVDKITKGNNGLIYGVRSTYDEYWVSFNSFFTYNPSTDVINETSFFKDAPATFKNDAIYLLEVDEKTGFIYVGVGAYFDNNDKIMNYELIGTIYQFDETGKFIRSFESGGYCPSAMIFID